MIYSKIISCGSYLPEKLILNSELPASLGTNDEWITTRTGIKERRIAAANEFTSDLATSAALRAQLVLQQAVIRQQEAEFAAKAAQLSYAVQDADRYRSLATTSAGNCSRPATTSMPRSFQRLPR